MGSHVGPGSEVASRWRLRGRATSARARRRSGERLAGVLRHGELRGWYQQREGETANLVATSDASRRGRKVVGGEVWRREASVVVEVDAPEVLRRRELVLRLRNVEAVP